MIATHGTREPSPTTGADWLLQRKCACGGDSGPQGQCEECEREEQAALQPKLWIGAQDEPLEREADRVAEQVMAAEPPAKVTPASGALARKPATAGPGAGQAPGIVHDVLREPGQPLASEARGFFEPRFGHDFARVRVHADARADASAQAVQARAYTVGHDLVFAAGQYRPQSPEGRQLLAHELTHVLQQGPGLRRKPADKPKAAAPDPLCAKFDFDKARKAVEAQAKLAAKGDLLQLIRALKPIRRCASATQQAEVKSALASALSADKADEAWKAAGTAFGGYVSFYPGFAPDIKTHLGKLGASESLASDTFELSAEGATHKSRAKKTAKADLGDLGRTDIVYFRGHQYAQYKAPGLFADGDETRGFDLRYVEKAGGFANVKLMISTSCATLCKEAVAVFTSLFPNAVILGYRKSAPLQGAAVRSDLTKRINELNRPLLIDDPVDVAAIIDTWKSVVESRHKGETGPQPGILQGGTVTYWDGSAWQTIAATDAKNACKVKGDFRDQYPAP
ncbi:eCIS core domain-containing protein [Pseudomonas sp. A6]|uniref:eCIS core domain-containing protein n=1 Tax=Pseudomonas sp. A6 TaxID=410021 RepID=UPI0040259246